MTEAYVLAGELALADGDIAAAFLGYERRLRQFLVTKQDAALRFAGYTRASGLPFSRRRRTRRRRATQTDSSDQL